jgi:hypothetical protein
VDKRQRRHQGLTDGAASGPATVINCALLLTALLCGAVFAAEPDLRTEREISHLIVYLQGSDCEFNRNGTWYTPEKAVAHIDRKYRYLVKRGLVVSTEQFIDRAASRSSMSGRSYLVKCGDAEPVESAVWFTDELHRFRAERPE